MDKVKMELTWHSCSTCPPAECYNPYLFITNGDIVVTAEYKKGYGFFVVDKCEPINDEGLWWADIDQTVRHVKELRSDWL